MARFRGGESAFLYSAQALDQEHHAQNDIKGFMRGLESAGLSAQLTECGSLGHALCCLCPAE